MFTSQTSLIGLSLLSAVNAVQYGYNHVPVNFNSEQVGAQFQDVDVELNSPYFLNGEVGQPGFANGTQGPTSHEAMEDFMEEVASRNSYMTYHAADFTSEEHRSFPFVYLSSSGNSTAPSRRRDYGGKVRLWLQGAAHGNEPAGDESLLALLGKFDAEPEWASEILSKVDIVVIPRYNPDGVFYFQRILATNFDPNRDHIKLARQQTREIKSLMAEFAPHVVADMHEYGATARYAGGRYMQASDGLFSAAKNLNIDEDIRALSEELFAKNMGEAMDAANLRWEPYVTGSTATEEITWNEAGTDGKIGRNAMGLTQAVTFLIEMRGIGIADQQFQRRTAAGLTMVGALVETAAENAAEVYETVEGGIKNFIESSEEIVVTDYSQSTERDFTMIEAESGEVVQVPVTFMSTTPAVANLTRARPEAYIIPVAWADLAERLRASGLEVETLDEGFKGSVEAYTIESTEFESSYYEGVVRVAATTEVETKEKTLPKGSFRVSTRQKNAALALIALEPENIDSYVSFNILPVAPGDEYPIFREMA